MDSFIGWLLAVIASTAGSTALLALAGKLFRTQLTHWLNKDLESVKAQHQRDLEAYKVSLIAEAERAKASQDVRKAMAVRIAENKFEAINALHTAGAALASNALATIKVMIAAQPVQRQIAAAELTNKAMAASTAATLAAPYLSQPERALWHNFCGRLASLTSVLTAGQIPANFSQIENDLMQQQLACNAVVEAHFEKMLSMG